MESSGQRNRAAILALKEGSVCALRIGKRNLWCHLTVSLSGFNKRSRIEGHLRNMKMLFTDEAPTQSCALHAKGKVEF